MLEDLHQSPRPAYSLVGALLLLPTVACGPSIVVLGEYTDTDLGSSGTGGDASETAADSGSGGETEPGCVEDCDPDFAINHVSGQNFAGQQVSRLGNLVCDGPGCPESVNPQTAEGETIEDCLGLDEAQASVLGAEEYCRLSASWLPVAIEVGFETPVDRSSFEQVRSRLDDPTEEEPYYWHSEVVEVHGPGTAFGGAFVPGSLSAPDRQTSVVNETCAARLSALGVPWTEGELETLCVGTWDDDGVLRPLRMDPAMVFAPVEGMLTTTVGSSCDFPESGPDNCCSACDRILGPAVARYGVDATGNRRNANEGSAIPCTVGNDPLVQCRDLVLSVDRDDEPFHSYRYAWDGAEQTWPLPRYDKLRQTHPDDRPAALVSPGAACSSASDCANGQACIGTNDSGDTCSAGDSCSDRTCQPEWFGTCESGAGGTGWCVDRRFSSRGAGACLAADTDFAHGSAGDRLAECDGNGDGVLSSSECCDPALGGGPGCDPLYQSGVAPVPRYDRHPDLAPLGGCVCEAGQPDACAEVVDAFCEAPLGSGSDPGPESSAGDYAVPIVHSRGGVRGDETDATLEIRLANLGNLWRAAAESCAEARGLIGRRTAADGWVANEAFFPELVEDHDLAMCSGSTYRLVFAESDEPDHVRSAASGTLDGRSELVIETAQFRIAPGSLWPTDDLVIGACDELSVTLSNRFDPGPDNVAKLQLRVGSPQGPVVAGGAGCDPLASPAEVAAGTIPCMSIDHKNAMIGELTGFVDPTIHGQVLQPGTTYFVVLPGLADVGQMSDPEAYAAAFHDACGMPLIVGDTPEQLELSQLSFTVDEDCP